MHKRRVCIFVKSSLHAYKDNALSSVEHSESVWCRIPLSGNKNFGCNLSFPNSDSLHELWSVVFSFNTRAVNIGASHLLVVGDFNMPYINQLFHQLIIVMRTLLEDLYLIQHVTFPTRFRNNQMPSLLDLINWWWKYSI